jgi:ABC-2 type transport system permease protein
MRGHRLIAIARKEAIQIRRDWRSLSVIGVTPLLLMLLYGYAVNLDVKHLPTCVLDRSGTQASQRLLMQVRASRYFAITRVARDEREIVDGLDRGRCALAIVVPADFTQAPNGAATVQVIVDGTDANSASLGIRYAQAVVERYARDVRVAWLARRGGAMAMAPTVELRARAWFNEDLESTDAIVPGVVALVLALIGAFLTALTVAREWERGTMEQLVSTPVTPFELMIGKLLPYFVIGAVDSIFCLLVARFWFRIPLRGGWVALLGATALFVVASLTLGYLISVRARSQLDASRVSILATFLPSLMLSGFVFPIEQMPVALRVISTIVPARYFVTLLRTIFLKGSAPSLIWGDLLALAVAGVLFGALALVSFRKRIG